MQVQGQEIKKQFPFTITEQDVSEHVERVLLVQSKDLLHSRSKVCRDRI
jgi:hypothetical protein